MDYGEILSKSARILWKYKILWLFGLLASCAGGYGSPALNYSFDAGNFNYNFNNPALPPPMLQFFQNLAIAIRQTPVWIFVAGSVLVCGLGIVLWLVGIFGRTGLARGAWQADGGVEGIGFNELSRHSLSRYWRVAGMTLLVGLPGFAIALIVITLSVFGVMSAFSGRSPAVFFGLVCIGIPLFCVLIPVFWVLGIWAELATVAVVNEERGVIEGLRRGWRLITRYVGPVLLIGLLVLIAQLAFTFLLALIVAPIGLGAALGGYIFSGGATNLAWGLLIPLTLLALLVSLALGAVLQSYIGTVWTLTFRRLAAREEAEVVPVAPQVS